MLAAIVQWFASDQSGMPMGIWNTSHPDLYGRPKSVKEPRLAGMSMAMITLCMNLGMVIAPPLFGVLVEGSDWVTAGYVVVAAPILGILSVQINKMLHLAD